MPFYIGDWKKDPAVQVLTREQKMIWFEMLMLMWESAERGYLTINNKPMTNERLAVALNLDNQKLSTTLTLFDELGLYSRRESDNAIYSRKQVEIVELSEKRKNAGIKGGNPILVNQELSKLQARGLPNAIDIDINKDVINNINVLWSETFGRNPKIPEAEETEKLIEKFGYDKVYQIFKQATLDGFHKIKTLVDALDDQGNIKQKKIIDKYAKPSAVNLHPMNKTTCDACTKVAVLWSDGFAGCSYEHIIEAKQKRSNKRYAK